jgi:hypothetical protein
MPLLIGPVVATQPLVAPPPLQENHDQSNQQDERNEPKYYRNDASRGQTGRAISSHGRGGRRGWCLRRARRRREARDGRC